MSMSGVQTLESSRWISQASSVVCYVCDGGNTPGTERCAHCQAPMALARQAGGQKTPPGMVAVMGASSAGKTVYLGMLMDLLSHQPKRLEMLARGAFSITLQQTTVRAMASCRFPEKTPNEPDRWHWIHCQVRQPKRKHPRELVMLDLAGEALFAEIDHMGSYRVIGPFLRKCTAALVLVDAVRIGDATREEDYFAMKLLAHLSGVSDGAAENRAERPIAVVFTKADQCDACREDPAAFAQAHTPGLWQHCRERFPRHRFFASGVAGACATLQSPSEGRVVVPLRIEPHGIVEPFAWLMEQGW